MPRQKARCGKCGKESARLKNYKGQMLCLSCEGAAKRADAQKEKAKNKRQGGVRLDRSFGDPP